MKKPGDPCKLTCLWWHGPKPEAGDTLRTKTGRQYQILEIRGRVLQCVVLEKDAVPTGTVHPWTWANRNATRSGARPRR